MNEKLSFQNIVDLIALKAGVSKKAADTFAKAFFDTLAETLEAGDESVKVKGLGTFKLVAVGSRESVNVSNGERIVIPGYKKVAFTPEDGVVEFLNGKNAEEEQTVVKNPAAEEVSAIEETPLVVDDSAEEVAPAEEDAPAVEEMALAEATPVAEAETVKTIEELIQVSEPERVEEPKDAFAGIDMIISTPESVEDVRQQYEKAKENMEAAVEAARQANAEKVRLERLLDRLEKNVVPEDKGFVKDENNPSVETSELSKEEKRQEAFERLMKEPSKEEEIPQREKKKKLLWTISIAVFVAVIGLLLYQIFRNIEAVEEVAIVEQTTKKLAKPQVRPVKPVKPIVASGQPVQKQDKAVSSKTNEKTNEKKDEKVDEQRKSEQKMAEQKKSKLKMVEQKPAEKPTQKSTDESAQKSSRPATHVMQRGESLTRVSQKYYGTKDSVRAIIRKNNLKNPDNVPLGYVIKLP